MAYFRRKKMCYFKANKIKTIDYKDRELLKKFVMDNGKTVPRRTTGTSPQKQRELTKAIKLARFIALLPYCDRH